MAKTAADKERRKINKGRRRIGVALVALFRHLNGPLLKKTRQFKKAWAKKHGGSGKEKSSVV